MVLVIKLRFFNVFFLCKIDREKVFCNILDRKQIFLGHKNFDLIKKSSKNVCNECNNDSLFPEKYTVKEHISNTKLEKGHHYYIQTRHKDLFPITTLF